MFTVMAVNNIESAKQNQQWERAPGGEVQKKSASSFQEFSPRGVTQDALCFLQQQVVTVSSIREAYWRHSAEIFLL